MKPEVYRNKRGETVMTYRVFQGLNFESLCKALKIPTKVQKSRWRSRTNG